MTTANTTVAIWCEWIGIIPILLSDQQKIHFLVCCRIFVISLWVHEMQKVENCWSTELKPHSGGRKQGTGVQPYQTPCLSAPPEPHHTACTVTGRGQDRNRLPMSMRSMFSFIHGTVMKILSAKKHAKHVSGVTRLAGAWEEASEHRDEAGQARHTEGGTHRVWRCSHDSVVHVDRGRSGLPWCDGLDPNPRAVRIKPISPCKAEYCLVPQLSVTFPCCVTWANHTNSLSLCSFTISPTRPGCAENLIH